MLREIKKWPGIRDVSESHPLSTPTMFGRRPLPRSWVILLTDRMTEQTIASLRHAALAEEQARNERTRPTTNSHCRREVKLPSTTNTTLYS